ncbi:MAG: Flp pilus assembly protein CpaB [Anaerolineae bacterium]
MRGGRMLIIIGFVVLLGAVVVGVIMWWNRRTPTPSAPEEVGTVVPYVTPEQMAGIVVAAQNLPRGTRITSDTVQIEPWPTESVPEGALNDAGEALGRIARVDIVRNMPILEGMLTEVPGDLGAMGSDAALQIPPGKVAYALPVARWSSVAWAIQPGDHVDVLISLLLVDLDEEFQSILPSNASCMEPPEGEGCQSGVLGRMEVLANGWVVGVGPSEAQRPRMVTQLTVQDAEVLRVGDWPMEGEEAPPPAEVEEPVEGEAPPPEPQRAAIEPLTLIVTPQDAMVLKYAEETGASMDLVLRSAGDRDKGLVTTESVTLQYIFDRFSIELPPKLPYGVEPRLQELRRGPAGEAGSGGGSEGY